jgi:hypothetical protein
VDVLIEASTDGGASYFAATALGTGSIVTNEGRAATLIA